MFVTKSKAVLVAFYTIMNRSERKTRQLVGDALAFVLLGGTWRIWSNINTIGVHFSTTFK